MKNIRTLKDLSKALVKFTARIVSVLCVSFCALLLADALLENFSVTIAGVLSADIIAWIRSVLMLVFGTPSVFESFGILFSAIAMLLAIVAMTSIFASFFIVVFLALERFVEAKRIQSNVQCGRLQRGLVCKTKLFILHQQYRL